MSDENYLTIAEGDSLTIESGDHFSVGGGASVSGSIDGEGTLGLNWTGFTSDETQENISAQIVEENIPSLAIETEVSSRTLIVSVEDIGAESYLISVDDEPPVDVPLDTLDVKINGLEPSTTYTLRLNAENSRGDIITDTWQITLGAFFTVYETAQDSYAQPNQTHGENAVFMARLIDKETGIPLSPNDVESITFNAWKYRRNETGASKDSVPGFSDIEVPTDTVLAALENSDFWTVDEGKINFIHVPDQRGNRLFPTPGEYLVEYEIRLKNGNPINLHYELVVY